MQFAGFHLRRGRGAIGDHAPDDAIEIGRVGTPVILVAVGDDVLSALVFDELERAGADRREIGRVLADIAALVEMLGRDVAEVGQGAQQQIQRHRPLVFEDRGLGVRRFDRGQEQLQRRTVIEDLLPHVHGGEFDVGRGERLAVVPGDALAQLEGHGLAVGRGFPALGEHADGLAVGIEIDEVFLDLAADDVDAGGRLNARIELALLGAVMDVEHAALARRFLRKGPHRIDHIGRDGRRCQQRGAAIDLKARQIHAKSPEVILMADRSGVRLAAMLRWKENASHFLIAARSGKSFLKTTCSPPVQPAHFCAPAQRSGLAGIEAEGRPQPGIAGKTVG